MPFRPVDHVAALFGLLLALLVAGQATRALRRGGSFYDREVYGVVPRGHRFARMGAGLFACVCLTSLSERRIPIAVLVALASLAGVLYLSSFARGFGEEERNM